MFLTKEALSERSQNSKVKKKERSHALEAAF
jgi:hypothetical protein